MIRIQLTKTLMATNNEPLILEVAFHIEEGEFIAISGPSGSGKTTLLRIIAGLVHPDKGLIQVGKDEWLNSTKKINRPVQKRDIGLVFQDYALFPNMTVRENLQYGLQKGQAPQRVEELIHIMELEELTSRYPLRLSGGQQQRVALARALVRNPKILLLDEPLSALDIDMRSRLQDYILKLHKTYHLTTLLVTHDYGEIFKMANRVFLIKNGKITNAGDPNEILLPHPVIGKYKFAGKVLRIEKNDIVFIVSVLIGNNLVKAIASPKEVAGLKVGDKVMLVSKAFTPMLIRGEW